MSYQAVRPDRRHWRNGLWWCVAVCAGLLSSAVAAHTIRFAPEKDYPPFVSAGPAGHVQGLSVDVLEILRPRLGGELQHKRWAAYRPGGLPWTVRSRARG